MRISKPVTVWASSIDELQCGNVKQISSFSSFWLLVMMFHHSNRHLKQDNIWKIRPEKLSSIPSWRRVNPLTWTHREEHTSHYMVMPTNLQQTPVCVSRGQQTGNFWQSPGLQLSACCSHTSGPIYAVCSSWPVLLFPPQSHGPALQPPEFHLTRAWPSPVSLQLSKWPP